MNSKTLAQDLTRSNPRCLLGCEGMDGNQLGNYVFACMSLWTSVDAHCVLTGCYVLTV